MISVPSPFQPYRVLTDEPTTLRSIISEQILMQSRFIVKIRPRQPAAHHRPGLAGERGAQCPDVAPILAPPELHNQPASGGELRIYLVSKYECLRGQRPPHQQRNLHDHVLFTAPQPAPQGRLAGRNRL